MLSKRDRRWRQLCAADDSRPHRLIGEPPACPQYADQEVIVRADLARQVRDDGPQRTKLGPRYPQILGRHLRDSLSRHLHVVSVTPPPTLVQGSPTAPPIVPPLAYPLASNPVVRGRPRGASITDEPLIPVFVLANL